MFYVSISKDVLEKVKEQARETENEIIGILVGTIKEHTIMISDAVSGEQEQESTRATLPPTTIAKVTDKILKGEISGRIVGWYHSHPGFGIFMSQTDINTQNNLQQFSAKVTALIVDPENEDFGFFTLHDDVGVIQLEKDQVHVYEEGEEKIPKHFSETPKVPKKIPKRIRHVRGALPPQVEQKGPNKIMVIGIVAAAVMASISFLIFYDDFNQEPDISSVDEILLFGNNIKNQQNISVFSGRMGISANITVTEGRITDEGVRFYIMLFGGGWFFLGNDTIPINNTYEIFFNTSRFSEGFHQINVNFTDSMRNTWAKDTGFFIIDNIEDRPIVRFVDPDPGDEIDGNTTLLVEVHDSENNIYAVGFYYSLEGLNWTKINNTKYWSGENIYKVIINTNSIADGNLTLKVEAEDRNLYMGMDEIKVIVSNGD